MNSNVRPENMARITTKELADAFIAEQIADIRAQVGDKRFCLLCRAELILLWLRHFL